ncbi:MAG: NAD-dependent epimerase/dehydratase family protein [Paracoccaceae bacterium]
MRTVFVTGSAGFIGYHLCRLLLEEGFRVVGYDGMTDYYDVTLKRRRHQMLMQHEHFSATEAMLEDEAALAEAFAGNEPQVVVHLAAQAGVRYSLENPRAYVNSNLIGTFNVLECVREAPVEHLLMASTSSVYGANEKMPFVETDQADTQLTLYSATKKATESMGHAYAHLWKQPTTMFRFFTVYGPWGRPDMALFRFTEAILNDRPIDVYNHGNMARDFTYVGDLVRGIRLLIDTPPQEPETPQDIADGDTLSPVAPFRIVNIGNSDKVSLSRFIEEIEAATGRKAARNYMDMQKGDVPETWADCNLLRQLTGYRPQTAIRDGVRAFVDWYRDYNKR